MTSSPTTPPTPPTPLLPSALIFPHLSAPISTHLGALRRTTLSLPNRLRSILADARFAACVAAAFARPLVANERCGSWYIPPERKAAGVYFKSTDGHWGQWGFSTRRLNLGVLGVVEAGNGCVIVDSTRRGKRMPDALSKTVPIWCAVLNRALFPDQPEAHRLHTPPQCVAASEHAQIEARLDGFVEQLKDLALDLPSLRAQLSKPLRPLWITQDSQLPPEPPSFPDFHPVILCTASRRVEGPEASAGGYIQGAGDDAEAWACGLTPPVFWAHRDALMAAAEDELEEIIRGLVRETKEAGGTRTADVSGGSGAEKRSSPTLIKPADGVYLGTLDDLQDEDMVDGFDAVIYCADRDVLPTHAATLSIPAPSSASSPPPSQPHPDAKKPSKILRLHTAAGKLGSRDLRRELPRAAAHVGGLLGGSAGGDGEGEGEGKTRKILVACATGRDLAVGVLVMLLCLFFDDNGAPIHPIPYSAEDTLAHHYPAVDKKLVRRRLGWVSVARPDANPARATLVAVNAFLMGRPEWWDGRGCGG